MSHDHGRNCTCHVHADAQDAFDRVGCRTAALGCLLLLADFGTLLTRCVLGTACVFLVPSNAVQAITFTTIAAAFFFRIIVNLFSNAKDHAKTADDFSIIGLLIGLCFNALCGIMVEHLTGSVPASLATIALITVAPVLIWHAKRAIMPQVETMARFHDDY